MATRIRIRITDPRMWIYKKYLRIHNIESTYRYDIYLGHCFVSGEIGDYSCEGRRHGRRSKYQCWGPDLEQDPHVFGPP
jgi:hypothetical protein